MDLKSCAIIMLYVPLWDFRQFRQVTPWCDSKASTQQNECTRLQVCLFIYLFFNQFISRYNSEIWVLTYMYFILYHNPIQTLMTPIAWVSCDLVESNLDINIKLQYLQSLVQHSSWILVLYLCTCLHLARVFPDTEFCMCGVCLLQFLLSSSLQFYYQSPQGKWHYLLEQTWQNLSWWQTIVCPWISLFLLHTSLPAIKNRQ